MKIVRVASLALAVAVVSCNSGTGSPPSGQPVAGIASEAPFDVADVVERARLSFRPSSTGGFEGGHATFTADADVRGVRMRPRHRPDGSTLVEGAALEFGVSRLTRGTTVLSRDPSAPALEASGALRFARGSAVERWQNRPEGVEQTWHFESAPAGQGDLSIHVPVRGMTLSAVTATGAHFEDAASGLGFRYGHATWIDAAGRATRLTVRAAGAELAIVVPASLLEDSSWPAVLDPVITPEFGMDTPVVAAAANAQSEPRVATDGTNFLVVWEDSRAGTPDVYAARVDATGMLLDPGGIAIAATGSLEVDPAVAFNGTDYLVVWTHDDVAIHTARVSTAGNVLGGGFLVSAPGFAPRPAVASLGSEFLVVWRNNGVYAARVGSNGALIGTTITVAGTANFNNRCSVAGGSTGYLVAWDDIVGSSFHIRVARVAADGTVPTPGGTSVRSNNSTISHPAVAFDGTNFLVAWYDRISTQDDIYGARVTQAGAVIAPGVFLIAAFPDPAATPWVSFDGTNYLVAYSSGAPGALDIFGSRVTTGGVVIDTFLISSAAGNQSLPGIAFGPGGNHFVAWADNRTGTLDVRGSRVSPAGVVSGDVLLTTSVNAQQLPSVASDGTNFIVVWQDFRSGTTFDVYGTRVTNAGAVLDLGGIAISTAAGSQLAPKVAFDGTNYLVVWQDFRGGATSDIYGARVTPGGSPSANFAISTSANDQQEPAIAFNGTNYLVAWADRRSGSFDLYATRVTPAGALLDSTGIAVVTGGFGDVSPAIAAGDGNFLVVWNNVTGVSGGVSFGTSYAARVSSAGALLDASPVSLSDGSFHRANTVVFDGANYLVAWHRPNAGIRARFVSPAAVPAPAFALTTAATAQDPSAAFDGTYSLVAWQAAGATSVDIYATRVSPAGAVLPVGGFALASEATDEVAPRVTVAAANRFLVAYSRQAGALRARARFVTFDAVPVATGQSLSTDEDAPLPITLGGTDADAGDTLTFAVVLGPANGTLSGSPPNLVYTPVANFFGTDSFTFVANDGDDDSAPATVGIDVLPIADPPVADGKSVSTSEDIALGITLTGSDPDGDTLTFAVAAGPAHGTLTGTAPALTYTPDPNYAGPDSFTFTVADGGGASPAATITIDVLAVNDPPVANSQLVTTDEDTPRSITLTGNDPDAGATLSYGVASPPQHGTLSGVAPNVLYTPAADYAGDDSFTFTVHDGTATSAPATVAITVTAVNDLPTGTNGSVTTDEDTPTAVTLAGTDADGDDLTFTVTAVPTRGSLTGTPPALTYTPDPDESGTDAIGFTVSDAVGTSAVATITVQITAVNDRPIANAQTVFATEDSAHGIVLGGSDADGDALDFAIVSGPTKGTLSGTAPSLVYTPDPDEIGTDSFTFTADDGTVTSMPATVTVEIAPVNDVPTGNDAGVPLDEDTPVPVTLTGTDADGDGLTFLVVTPPLHGTLSGTPPSLTYTPVGDYHGGDSFGFTASDAASSSSTATVSLTIAPIDDAPVATPQSVSTPEDTPLVLVLSGADVDGDTLTFAVLTLPSHGVLSGVAPNLTYTPDPDFAGDDSFTFGVTGAGITSAPATVDLAVMASNDVPVANADSVSTAEDAALEIALTATDSDGDAMAFTVVTPPAHGTLSGDAPVLTYTPGANFFGSDSFTFTVNDGIATSNTAVVDIGVTAMNDAPAATDDDVATAEDAAVGIVLVGTDVENDTLTFSVTVPPVHGVLSGTAPNLTFTPDADFAGDDSFSFVANDGTASSAAGTIALTVAPVNDAPVAIAAAETTTEDAPLAITLEGGDVDGDPLVFAITAQPLHGTLSGTAPDLLYTPAADFHGADSLAFTVTDGAETSSTATLTFDVTSVNDVPVAAASSAVTDEETPVSVTLAATDADGDALTFTVVRAPEHGTLSGSAPSLTYAPTAGYSGPDDFAFVANDGTGDSAEAEVTLTVNALDEDGGGGAGGCACSTTGGASRGAVGPLTIVAGLGLVLAGRRRRERPS